MAPENRMSEAADCDRPAAGREVLQEAHRLSYFGRRGPSVRPWLAVAVGVSGHHVPQQHVRVELELRERAMDDRRRRLGRARAGELALGRERKSADACAAVAGRLADEQVPRLRPPIQVVPEPLAAELGAGVLVEGRADARPRKRVDERAWVRYAEFQRSQRTTSSRGLRRSVKTLAPVLGGSAPSAG
jgi:hypothetical protein